MDLSFYKGKKVLVTGHTGFKGSWLCRILVKAGAEVTGYSLVPPTTPNLFSMADIENNINSVIGDIRDLEEGICGNTAGNSASLGSTANRKGFL